MKSKQWLLVLLVSVLFSCSTDTPAPNFDAQLEKDIAAIDDYLAKNNINAIKDTTGVRYVINTEGPGEKPTTTSVIYVSIKETVLSTGTVYRDFKDQYGRGQLGDANSVFPAFQVVLPKVKKGSSITIYSPSGYAYGTASSSDGNLPANANIIFNINLLDEPTQFKLDTTAIQSYITTKGITGVIKDQSGLRYVITSLGTGAKPLASSRISFNYVGKLLATEAIFDQSSSAPSAPLNSLIQGFQIGMQQLPSGSKAVFYIPSSLGYGPTGDGRGTIASNSNLIFEVELVSVN
jgi:FKBP-type peptidyl-prolyl cis-trans isomerase FkpA